jgi:hypothetical protein
LRRKVLIKDVSRKCCKESLSGRKPTLRQVVRRRGGVEDEDEWGY